MRNPISKLRSMLRWLRFLSPRRTLSGQSPGNPGRAKGQAVEALSPQKFREMFAGMLADPEAREALARSLGACLPIEGGTACSSITSDGTATANSITMFTSACNIQSSVITQLSGKVGIGITTPLAALHIFAATSQDSDAKYNLILGDNTTAGQGVGGGIDFSGYYNGTSSKAGFANIRGVKENGTRVITPPP